MLTKFNHSTTFLLLVLVLVATIINGTHGYTNFRNAGCEEITDSGAVYSFVPVWSNSGGPQVGPAQIFAGAQIVRDVGLASVNPSRSSGWKWDVKKSPRGFARYTVTNRESGFSLSSSGSNAVLLPLGSNGEGNDDWCFVPVSDYRPGRAYNIVQLSTGRILGIRGSSGNPGAPLELRPPALQSAGRFYLRRQGSIPPPPTPAPTVPLCKENGQTCDNGETCCNTLTCQATIAGGSLCLAPPPPPPPPPTCVSEDESCASPDTTCCGDLRCRNTSNGPTCLAPAPVCQAENVSCANGETCCGTLICQNTSDGPICLFPPRAPPTTPTPPTVPPPTPPGVCQGRGSACGADGQTCCASLTCQNTRFGNLCRPPVVACRRRGLSCGNGEPCCGIQNTCQNTSFGPICRPAVAPVCQSRGSECGNGVACCSGLTCQRTNFGNLCRPGGGVFPPAPTPPVVPPVGGATFDTLIFLTGPSCANIVADLTADVTVFGPTDAAFAAFLTDTGLTASFLCSDAGIDTLATILTYHAIPGAVTGEDIKELIPNTVAFETLNGAKIEVDTVNLEVNDIQISFPDARRSPYVLHGIDGVLLPPGFTLPDVPSAPTPPAAATFDSLIFLIGPNCANIVADLTADVTVFGPTDAAFAAFLTDTGLTASFLCSDAGIDTLATILTYHAIPGAVTGEDIKELIPNTVAFETLNGAKIEVDTVNLEVNEIPISVPDARKDQIPYVLHGIDGVLIPPGLTLPDVPSAPTPPAATTFDTLIFLTGARCANIVADLTSDVTVFGPTDAAFATFLASTGLETSFLCGDTGINVLRTILTYHAIPGAVTGDDLKALVPNTVEFETLNNGEVIAVDTVNLKVNEILISVPDARNSEIPYVLHGIDSVLIPSGVTLPPTTPSPPEPPVTPPGTCRRRGRSCTDDQSCCTGLTCKSTNFGLLCRP